MLYTQEVKEFFDHIPALGAQFGNLLTIREMAGIQIPGIPQCFISSVMQFQPLLEVAVFTQDGERILLEHVTSTTDPIEKIDTFTGSNITLHQRLVVEGDQALLELKYDSASDVYFLLSGSCLFSPQGIPYHWDDEGKCKVQIAGNQLLEGEWNTLGFSIATSEAVSQLGLASLKQESICKKQYFTSHNLKKRYTYWVDETTRMDSLDSETDSVFSRNSTYCFKWVPAGNKSLSVRFTLNQENRDGFPVVENSIATLKRTALSRWKQFLATLPTFDCPNERLKKAYYTSWYILFAGQIDFPEKRMEYPFTSVNKFHYYNQFFWDSAFQTIAWIWSNDSLHAEQEMKNFVLNQWRNGMIPYELFMYPVNGREWMDGDGKTSGATQPPVIGITIAEVFAKYRNTEYLKFFYEALLKYDEWLTLYRDFGKRGLSAYTNIWETGWDNSPRFDEAARNRVMDPFIEGVDFNVYIYQLRTTMLEMARILGKPEPEGLRKKQELTKSYMNSLMYCVEDGFYYDLEAGTDNKIPVKTAAGLLPLMTDIPSKEQRERLINEYLLSDKEFFSGAPVPSVSRSETSYCSYDFWRGANWPQITWSILYGIQDTHPKAAASILDRFLSTTTNNDNCYEYYDAETGEGSGLPFHGWGALYTDFIIRFVVGIHPSISGFSYHAISEEYQQYSLANVKIHDLTLSIKRENGECQLLIESFGTLSFPATKKFTVEMIDSQLHIQWESVDPKLIAFDGICTWTDMHRMVLTHQ